MEKLKFTKFDIPREFTTSVSSVQLSRFANEGFKNYVQKHIEHEEEEEIIGCYAFAYKKDTSALSYSTVYLEEVGLVLTDRSDHQEHELVLPHDFPVVAKRFDDVILYYDLETHAFVYCDNCSYWFNTTIGYIYERWQYFQQKLSQFRNECGIPEDKKLMLFREYHWFECIVDAKHIQQYTNILETE